MRSATAHQTGGQPTPAVRVVANPGKARVGTTNVLIRCLVIGEDFVRIRLEGSGEERELRFKNHR